MIIYLQKSAEGSMKKYGNKRHFKECCTYCTCYTKACKISLLVQLVQLMHAFCTSTILLTKKEKIQ